MSASEQPDPRQGQAQAALDESLRSGRVTADRAERQAHVIAAAEAVLARARARLETTLRESLEARRDAALKPAPDQEKTP